MTDKAKRQRKPKQAKTPPISVLSLDYNLAELPTSQHRAGLAGLVLMVQWMENQQKIDGICQLTRLDDHGATLQIDERGMKSLYAQTYDSIEEQKKKKPEKEKPSKKATAEEEQPNEDETVGGSGENDKPDESEVGYKPRGAFLVSYDPTADNAGKGLWVDLWRDFVWYVVRKKWQSQQIYSDKIRLAKTTTDVWGNLVSEATSVWGEPSDLSGADLIGARAHNAEQVEFKDTAKHKLLLNFWSYTAQVYVPMTTVIGKMTKKPEPKDVGYAVAIPEVARLSTFCRILPKVLHINRGKERSKIRQKRPKDSLIDVPAEGALDFFLKLSEQISLSEGARTTNRMVSAIDVIHVDPSGKDMSITGTARIEPESFSPDDYERVRRNLWNREFRRQRVLNILDGRKKWYEGFDKLLSRLPFKLGFDGQHFAHDARESFESEVRDLKDKKTNDADDNLLTGQDTSAEGVETNAPQSKEPKSVEALVYQAVGRYLDRRLRAKRKSGYSDVKAGTADKDEYSKERRALAVNAFYSVKSRTEADFIEYFANTLCSVSQNPISETDYVTLAKALHHETEDVRTLTMLALSAHS